MFTDYLKAESNFIHTILIKKKHRFKKRVSLVTSKMPPKTFWRVNILEFLQSFFMHTFQSNVCDFNKRNRITNNLNSRTNRFMNHIFNGDNKKKQTCTKSRSWINTLCILCRSLMHWHGVRTRILLPYKLFREHVLRWWVPHFIHFLRRHFPPKHWHLPYTTVTTHNSLSATEHKHNSANDSTLISPNRFKSQQVID